MTRFADGSLSARERAVVMSAARLSADTRRQLARQYRVAAALRGGGPQLSPSARQRLVSHEYWLVRRAERDRSPALRTRPWRFVPVPALALVAVLGAALVGWRLERSPAPTAPTIAETAALALLPGTAAPPVVDRADRASLQARVGTVRFPDYQRGFGAPASAQRTDRTGGRMVRTVYYTLRDGARLSYSIVSGPPLAAPGDARTEVARGVVLRSYRDRGLSVVTLVRSGHTCVLAGRIPTATVLALAAAPLEHVSRT